MTRANPIGRGRALDAARCTHVARDCALADAAPVQPVVARAAVAAYMGVVLGTLRAGGAVEPVGARLALRPSPSSQARARAGASYAGAREKAAGAA